MSTPQSTALAAYVVEVPAPFPTTTHYLLAPGKSLRVEFSTVQPGAYRLTFTTNTFGDAIAVAPLDLVVNARRSMHLGFLPWFTFPRILRTEEYAWDLREVGDGWPAVVGDDDVTPLATFRRIA